jgi:acyl-CoA synthetase (NDP forming)
MLTTEMRQILETAKPAGWVLEPEAKRLFQQAGLEVPRFIWTKELEEAGAFAEKVGYPVVAKIVSPAIVHKSDAGGVITGIKDRDDLARAFRKLGALKGYDGVLVEEALGGVEIIVGAKVDLQFGAVVLVGMGGTSTEIYKDTAVRLAPLSEADVRSMIASLKARPLLEGYRGSRPIDMEALTGLLIKFSVLVADMEEIMESIDLNPVFCSPDRCVIADARIMLART